MQALTTILGNLIDNAFDALAEPGGAGGSAGSDGREPGEPAASRSRSSRTTTGSPAGGRQRPRHPGRSRPNRSSPTASPPSRRTARCAAASAWPWCTGWCSGWAGGSPSRRRGRRVHRPAPGHPAHGRAGRRGGPGPDERHRRSPPDAHRTAPIRTLIVDDDYRVAGIHAAYVARIDGFEVVGRPTPRPRRWPRWPSLRPDLVLMDVYLPDGDGLAVVRKLMDDGTSTPTDRHHPPPRATWRTVRTAMQLGAVHYLVKPFGYTALHDRLPSYRDLRLRMAALDDQADQSDVDELFGLLRGPGHAARPIGQGPLGADPGTGPQRGPGVRDRHLGGRGRRAGRHQPRHRPAVSQLSGLSTAS